ncbi:MAG TPA: hypothetical protein VHM90_08910 [Phycisphaerae bacterium]|nr:hypothetical protein [Phycisphaerae bacterium]
MKRWPRNAVDRGRPSSPKARLRSRFQPFVIVSAALFLIACATPAVQFRIEYHDGSADSHDAPLGAGLLFIGWLGVLYGVFAWYANLPLLLSWILAHFRVYWGAAAFASIALLISLDTFALYTHRTPQDEGGGSDDLLEYPHIGFYLWTASMLVIVAGGIRAAISNRNQHIE